MIKRIYFVFYAIKSNIYIFKNVNYLFVVSDETFGVSGMVRVGVSGTTPMMLLSSYTLMKRVIFFFENIKWWTVEQYFNMNFSKIFSFKKIKTFYELKNDRQMRIVSIISSPGMNPNINYLPPTKLFSEQSIKN